MNNNMSTSVASSDHTAHQSLSVRVDRQAEFRKLPAVDALLRTPTVALLAAHYGQQQITDA
ncbi:MAG: hypothetical protein KDE53_04460, partial [Caldilineaceae bacterium]|nr:hypothetical protein [Caldilineaceae bacterium]